MAFCIVPNPTFKAFVGLTVPGQDVQSSIELEFRHKGKEALAAWLTAGETKADAEILSEVVIGWAGVIDDNGDQVVFSIERLFTLLEQYPASGREIFRGYLAALTESKRKN